MNRLKRLIVEIHRRSLWQVLGIYLVGAWIAFQIVQTLTEGLGLPDWFPGLALGLLIVLLPVVLATAFVQEGVRGPRRAEMLAPIVAGPGAAEPAVGEARGAHHRLLTWRNAGLGVVIALGLWGVVATGWYLLADRAEPEGMEAAEETRQSIAVLPFENLSPDPENEFFADGMAEEIMAVLAKIEGLRVAARTSTFKLRDEDVATVGARLKVSSVLEGSVRKQGNRVRVTAQLIDVADGFHLWSETFERELTDIFAVQDEIARAIAGALRVELTGEDEAALAERGTESIDAYNSYLLGRYYWNKRTPDGLWSAVAAFEEAIELDPEYALAYAGLADAYIIMATYEFEPGRVMFPKAKAAALEAMARDEDLAAAHLSLAAIQNVYDRDWEAAERSYRRALELDPGNAFAHYWYSAFLECLGRTAEAEAMVLRARQLDPLAPQLGVGVSHHYIAVGDFDEAETVLQEVLDVDPNFPGALFTLGFVRLRLGRYEEVLQNSERYKEIRSAYVENRVEALLGLGRHDEAFEIISQARAEADSIYWDPVTLAGLYAMAGDTEEVFSFLERACEEGSARLAIRFCTMRSHFDRVRSDPRFSEFIRRVGLDPAMWVR